MGKYNLSVFGVKETTKIIVEHLHNIGQKIDLIISIDKNVTSRNHISGYYDLQNTAHKVGADYYLVQDYALKKDIENFFNSNSFNVGISYGWQRLIPEAVLNRFENGVFGFHASPDFLPNGRGRSPLNWSILLEKKHVYDHFFKYDSGVDTGDVYSDNKIDINMHDTIASLEYKTILNAKQEIPRLLNDIASGKLELKPQHGEGYLFAKRTPEDGLIDFQTMNTRKILDIIRAVTHPFPGAFAYLSSGEKVMIWEAAPFTDIVNNLNYMPGQVIDNIYSMPSVKTLDGSILLKKYDGSDLTMGMFFCALK